MASNIKAKDVVKGMFSSYMPATINTADSAKQAASDVRAYGKKVQVGMRRNMQNIDKSQPGRKAIALFTAAKDALRDGTYEVDQVNDDMYDDYEEYESDFTTDSLTEEERESVTPEEIMLRGNRGIARTVIRASSSQLQAMTSISNQLLKGTLKGMEASTKSINATILYGTNMLATQMSAANNKLDVINENLVNLLNYQNENTTMYYEKNLELMNNMLTSMKNLNSMNQGRGAIDLKNFNVRNGFNIRDYMDRVKKGIKNSTAFTGAGMLQSMYQLSASNPDIMSMGEMIGSFIPTLAPMIPGVSKAHNRLSSFTKLDNRLSGYINEALYQIGDKLSSNMIAATLGLDSLGNKRRNVGMINTGMYMKEQLPWNGKAQKALTEVIPELLTSIDAGINSVDKRYYDYDEGLWRSREQLTKDFKDQVSNIIALESSTATSRADKYFKMNNLSEDTHKYLKKEISDAVTDLIYNQGDIKDNRQRISSALETGGLAGHEYAQVFNDLMNTIQQSQEQIADMYARIGSTNSVFANINNRSGETANKTIGKNAYQTIREDRNKIDIFGMTFSQDVDSTIDYITRQMKEIDSNFKLTHEIKAGIILAIRNGNSNEEILRMVKKTVGKGELTDRAFELIGRGWAKIRGKEYQKSIKPDESEETEDFGLYGNAVNINLMKKLYGLETFYGDEATRDVKNTMARKAYTRKFNRRYTEEGEMKPRVAKRVKKNREKVGAASSARTVLDGKVAGAGTTGGKPVDEGKSSLVAPVETDLDQSRDDTVSAALKTFDEVMNAPESELQHDEQVVSDAAENIAKVSKEGSTSLGGAIKNLIDASVTSMGAMMNSFARFGSRLFGKEGFISKFFESKTFKTGLEKVKKVLFYDEEGNLRPFFQNVKDTAKVAWVGTKEILRKGYDYTYDSYSKYRFGEDYENNENWQNSKFMQSLNLKAKRKQKKEKMIKDYGLTLVNEMAQIYKDPDGNYCHYDTTRSKFIGSDNKPITKKSFEPIIEETVENKKVSAPEIENKVVEVKSSVEKVSEDTPQVLKESVEKISEAAGKSAEMIEESTKSVTTAIIGDPDKNPEEVKKEYAESFGASIKKHLPKIGAGAVVGAGIGMLNGFGGHSLLGSLFLPTGLIGGAIVGGGLTILSQTEAFKSLMFGKKGADGERSGGLISNKLKESFKKALPIAVGGAAAGALGAIIKAPFTGGIASGNGLGVLGVQLLPGGILGGAIMGMGVGLLKNSETFKSLLFGKKDEDGKRTGTWLSKSFESMKAKMGNGNEGLKNMLKGGGIGALSGTVLAHMGAIPAALSMGGPVGMGIMGLGLGIASSSKKFDSWLFGEEEFDNDGKSLGRKGGVLGRVKNLINLNVVEPISSTFKSAMLDMIDWTKEKITLPFRTAFGPILDSIRGIKDNVVEFVSDKFAAVGDSIADMMKKTISTLFSPITKLIGGIGKAMISSAKVGIKAAALPLTGGLSLMNLLTSGKRFKENSKFYKSYYKHGMMESLHGYWDAKQADYDQDAAEYNAEADKTGKKHKAAKKVTFMDKVSDTLSAITGRGEIADAARKGWNAGADEFNQDSMGWREAIQEKKQVKRDRKERHKAEAQWNDIRKLSRKIGNRDLHGREVELTDAMLEKYKKKYNKLGLDTSLINNSSDLMKLIYHTDDFRKDAAGDTGRNGMLQALKDFRLTPEEIAERERENKYRDNVTGFLEDISNYFKSKAEDEFFDRSMSSYNEDRRKDKKRLKRKAKKLYNSTLWDGRDAINFNDPELNEYDIEGITDDDLNDYAVSKYADTGDFKGWLASKGRKMSPDDYRREFFDKEKLEKRRKGKSSILDNTTVNNDSLDWKDKEKSVSDNEEDKNLSKEMLETMKEQTNIVKTEAEINAGGSTKFKQLSKKAKRGTINAKTAEANGISGFFGKIFKKKTKTDERNAELAKEAEESKEAQALGDKKSVDENGNEVNVNVTTETKEKKQGILSKIFGGIGSAFSWFGGTKVGSILTRGLKLFGKIGLLGGIGLIIADIIKPGTNEAIGASIDNWNKKMQESAESGTLFDDMSNTVMGWFSKIGTWVNEKVLSEDGYLVKGATAIANVFPKVLDKVILPSINHTVDFITTNAEPLVNAAASVVTAVAPPLAEALVTTVPTVVEAIGEALWNRMWGKTPTEKGSQQMTSNEVEQAKSEGKYVGEKIEIVDEDEAKAAEEKGLEVYKNSDGTYSLVNNYTLDSNQYLDTQGREQTATKQSTVERFTRVGGSILNKFLTGNIHVGAKQLGKAVSVGAGTLGAAVGGSTGLLGGLGGMLTGGKLGAKLGNKVGKVVGNMPETVENTGNLINKVKSFFTKKGTDAVADTATNVTETAAKNSDGIFSKVKSFFTKKGTKAATDTAADVATDLAKAATNATGTGIEEVADLALKQHTDTLQKCADTIKDLTNNTAVDKAIKEGAEDVTEAAAKKGFKKVFNEVAEKLGTAMLEVSKKSKLGQKILNLLVDKGAQSGTKAALAVGTAGIVELATIGVNALAGALDDGKIANLFQVSTSMIDGKMRLISSVLHAALSSTVGSIVDLGFAVVDLVTGKNIVQSIAASLYKTFSSETGKAKLNTAQDTLAVETELYNQKNGTNMTTSEYNDAANKSWLSKAWGWIRGKNINNKGLAKEAKNIVESGNYSVNSNGSVTINQNVGNGTGASVVGYGPGQSQGNSAWANMPIGKFANGQVSTMKTGGCGPTALSTIANMYGPGINPGTVGAYAASNGFITNGGANEDLFTKGAAGLGLHGAKVGKEDITSALASGHPMAISGKNSGPFTKNGHVVVANGVSKNKISIIDPIDGKNKVYNKSEITSGMTNAWAYDKPVGYGVLSNISNTIKDKALSGLSDSTKLMMINTLGTVQTAIGNIPSILSATLESAFKPLAKTIATPLSVPISYAVDALGTLSKIIGEEEVSTEELQNATNSTTMLSNMSSSIKKSMSSYKINTSSVSSSKLTSNVKTTTGKDSILTKLWNKVTSKFKKKKNSGYGRGPVGYGSVTGASRDEIAAEIAKMQNSSGLTSNISTTLLSSPSTAMLSSLPTASLTNTAATTTNSTNNTVVSTNSTKVNDIINGTAGPVSYEYVYDTCFEYGRSIGFNPVNAASYAQNIADSKFPGGRPKSITNGSGSQYPEYIKYNTETGEPEATVSVSDDTSDTTTDTSAEISRDYIAELKSTLSKAPETIGDFIGGFKKMNNVFSALLGTIKGEGSFVDLYNQYAGADSGTTSTGESTNGITSSGVQLSDDEEKSLIYKTLRNNGYSHAAAVAIMGCWQAESSNRARVIEANWISEFPGYNVIPADRDALNDFTVNGIFKKTKGISKSGYLNTADNRYYPGIGYAQWTGPRAYKLLNFVEDRNIPWDSPESQIKYFNSEMDGSYSGLKTDLKNADDVQTATENFFDRFEMSRTYRLNHPDKFNVRLNYAKQFDELYKDKANQSVIYGPGSSSRTNKPEPRRTKHGKTVGYGPNDSNMISSGYDYDNWGSFTSGLDSAMTHLQGKLDDMGLGEFLNVNGTSSSGSTSGVTYDSSAWGSGNTAPLNAMKDIYGKLYYSLDGDKQDPDKGVASCASTVAWAYKKALGIRPGDSVSSSAYMSSTAQAKDNRFSTIWTNDGSGLTNDFISQMMPGDIVYTNWDRTKLGSDGKMSHTEMYAGNNQDISHGGPNYSDKGPVYKDLDSYRKKHIMMIRRYNGFLKNTSGVNYGNGPTSDDTLKLENNFTKEINNAVNDIRKPDPKFKPNPHGEGEGYGTGNDDVVERLDKIVTIIGEWYMKSKQEQDPTNNTTNNTIVNNTAVTNPVSDKTNSSKAVTTHIDKLSQKHQTFSPMYKLH